MESSRKYLLPAAPTGCSALTTINSYRALQRARLGVAAYLMVALIQSLTVSSASGAKVSSMLAYSALVPVFAVWNR